jgi:hypothetical protein
MKFNDSRVIRTVTVVWKGESVDVDVTYFNPGHAMPFAATPDCPGYDDSGEPGVIEYNTPMIAGLGAEFMEWLCLEDNDEFTDLVFEAMTND